MALPSFILSILKALKSFFDNALNADISGAPSFTANELAYIESDLANSLHIPASYLALLQQGNAVILKVTDPAEIAVLNNLKTLVDNALSEAGAQVVANPNPVATSPVTTEAERSAIASAAEALTPPTSEQVAATVPHSATQSQQPVTFTGGDIAPMRTGGTGGNVQYVNPQQAELDKEFPPATPV